MPQKISPNRRRSIAVLGRPTSSRASQQRRRAYSIVPGEKLSPAARARRLIPRKSILKSRASQDSTLTSTSTDELASNNATMTMDFTEIRASTSRKSLGRRVSFASHAHVRLFGPSSKDDGDNDDDEEGEEEDEEERHRSEQVDTSARKNSRRRSSTAFTELGERSMDMDEDDTAPIPRDFLNGPAIDDEEFDEDAYGDDMELTEAFPGGFPSSQSRDSLGLPRRRSSIAPVVTSSHFNSENRPSHPPGHQTPQRELYPSLDDAPDPSPSRPHDDRHDPDLADTTITSDMDITATSSIEHTTSSSGDNTQPMEFTIPVIRPPPPPTEAWLKLRAMTHSGEEPYVPPEAESTDDPEANAIVPAEGLSVKSGTSQSGDGDSMELTDALTRLAKARFSLGLPALPGIADTDPANSSCSVDDDNEHNETFTNTEDSFGGDMSLDENQTLNLTSMRMSLGGRSIMADSTMEFTNVYGSDGNNVLAEPSAPSAREETVLAAEPSKPPKKTYPADAQTEPSQEPLTETESEPEPEQEEQTPPQPLQKAHPLEKHQIFTLGKSTSSVPALSATTSAVSDSAQPVQQPLPLNIFSFSAKSQPPPSKPTLSSQDPKSPKKAPQVPTLPVPFTFTVPSRLSTRSSPSKQSSTVAAKVPAAGPSSPSKLPVFRGSAAFAPRIGPKSPLKRPAPPDGGDEGAPSPAKKQAVARLLAGNDAVQLSKPDTAAPANRRMSGVRRPSGYFAQRKSLGGATSHAAAPVPGLSRSVSAPTALSGTPSSKATLKAAIASNKQRVTPQNPFSLVKDSARDALSPDTSLAAPQSADISPTPDIHVERASSPEQVQTQKPSLPSANQRRISLSPFLPLPEPAPERSSPAPSNSSVTPPSTSNVSRDRDNVLSPQDDRPPPRKSVMFDTEAEEDPDEGPDEDGVETTEQWNNELDFGDDDEPTISIEQFFEMTNIRFMDEITAPRRSMIHPGHLGFRNRRRSLTSSHSEEVEQIPLAEFMTAMALDIPQLELYHELSGQLTAWVEESKKICRQAEEDVIKVTPTLFREFAEADESEKQDLLHQLKLIKAHNIDSAKSQWYDWKSSWVAQLQHSAEDAFRDLENDAKTLEGTIAQAQKMLPSLREQYAQIMAELEKEEADIAEIESSDKHYLSDLKVSIAEQDVEVQALQANVSEAQAKLERLVEKDAEIEGQKEVLVSAIAHGEELIQRQTKSTSSEVFRLKDELEALEDLHLWRATKLDADIKQFIYASRFLVSIPCASHKPIVSRLRVERTKASRLKERDEFPELTELMLTSAQHVASASRNEADLRAIIQRLGDFWTSCAQIRLQLTFLAIQYPLELKLVPVENGLPTFEVSAKVLFPSVKSKALIMFILDSDTYARWPLSIGLLKCDVKIAYGRADPKKILEAVQSRLSQATSSENHGCLLDACIEATEQLAFA